MMKQLARLKFSQNQLRVPQGWQMPSGSAGSHWGRAFKPEEKSTVPDMTVPPLFTAQSTNKYHTDQQKKLTEIFGGFIDSMCDAICATWQTWQSSATMVGLVITGPVGMGGMVQGPPWTPQIMAQFPPKSPQQKKYIDVMANVIGTSWQTYQSSITSPGIPFWPMFAAWALAVAPMTPNPAPMPFMMLTQVAVPLGASMMKQQMVAQLGDPKAHYANELFDAITDAFEKCFQIWQTTTMITKVMGTGPVPTFAPPYVPVGPVLGGVGTMAPGGFV